MSNLEEMLAEMTPQQSRRLSFHEKCAAYYALKRGFSQRLIGKTFGVSAAVASLLLNCQTNRRYRDVAREFERLGLEEFGRLYWTPEYDDRLARFRMGKQKPFDQMRGSGPNPTADQYQRSHESPDGGFTVRWMPGHGWIWTSDINELVYSEKPFRTSTAAYDAYWQTMFLPNPRKG